jgi:dienelactone hydrolase
MGIALAAACLVAVCASAPASAFDPVVETKNFLKTEERNQYVTLTPEFQARLLEQNVDAVAELAQITLNDPERLPTNICATRQQECAGDVRFYDWEDAGAGMMTPVLYTARSGATISGSVWATEAGPAKRPGIVITTGSVQAPETLYWGFAATLAKHGYVVLIYDVQGQGRSDTLGAGPDAQEGVPSQAGQPFFDGTEEGLDFLLSDEDDPYDPRPSCGNANGGVGTDHSDKQDRRVEDDLNTAFNPFWELVDPERIGIAGHSLGASAVSYIGQLDPRVDAIVAWDNLSAPGGGVFGGQDCPSGSSPRPDDLAITKPAIGMSNDYGLAPTPNLSDPGLESANGGFQTYKDQGVDSMQVNIRGGTHFEYSFIPGMTVHPLGLATLRGPEMAIWNTVAWFDKYVKCEDAACEAEADERLLSDRWREDERSAQVDPDGDANLYSFYKTSRYDLHTADGTEVTCDDMRAGCASMGPDSLPAGYSHVSDAFQADEPGGGGGGGSGEPCALPQQGGKGRDTPKTLPPSDAGDAIRGGRGRDRLRGGRGDDCLYGNRGNDKLIGGAGADKLRCGRGKRDKAIADRKDTVAPSCERVRRR